MILLRSILFNALFYLGTRDRVRARIAGAVGDAGAPARVSAITGRYGRCGWRAGAIGLRYEVRGREHLPAGPAIIAMKHQSAWDTFAASALFDDPAIVVKRELFCDSVLRLVSAQGRHDRHRPRSRRRRAAPHADAARAAVAQGRPILIFPEGTRTPVGADAPYHPGVGAAGAGPEAAAGAGGPQFRPVLGPARIS